MNCQVYARSWAVEQSSAGGAGSAVPLPAVPIGNGEAGESELEAILTLEGMRREEILPTINYDNRDPKCDLDYVPNEIRPKRHRISLSNSFGFGGQNACLCLARYDGD